MSVALAVFGLGPHRWLGIARLTTLTFLVEAALRILSLPRLARLLGVPLELGRSGAPSGSLDQLPLNQAERDLIDTAWRILRHRPFNGTCLRRALIGGHVLRHHQPLLRLGVAKSHGQVQAHAWVEISGISLDPDADLSYKVLQATGMAAEP
jgi:hypothetical protein